MMIAKKLVYAYSSKERADRAVEIGEITNKAFSGPAFAVVYTLVGSATNKRLQEKNIVIKE